MTVQNFLNFVICRRYFPALNSISEFISSTAGLQVEVTGTKNTVENLSEDDILEIATFILDKIKLEIEKGYTEYKGTKLFKAKKISEIAKDKIINIAVSESLSSDQERGVSMKESKNSELQLDLSKEDWYIYEENYGTSEEKYLVRFVKNMFEKLQEKYTDVYLLRNETLFKIYTFSNGKAIEPDFVLFSREKRTGKTMLYQLFIESKGGQLLITDKWKEDFLLDIESNCQLETLLENNHYKIIGMPFYNENLKLSFIDEFNLKLGL